MQKILIISYFFPPCSLTASQRPYNWANYLNEFGYDPIVLTRIWENPIKQHRDLSQATKLKTEKFERHANYKVCYLPYRSTFKDLLYYKYGDERFRFIRKSLSFMELYFQNYFLRAIPFSNFFKKAKEIIDSNQIEKVIITGSPFVSFYLGYKLKKRHPKIRWVADYRDDWTTSNLSSKKNFFQKILFRREQESEKKWLSNVEFITSVSNYYVNKISQYVKKPGYELLNGFDDVFSVEKQDILPENRFEITYNGSLYNTQKIEPFLEVLISIIERFKTRIHIHINFPGLAFDKKQEVRVKNKLNGYESHYTITERIDREKVIKIQRSSHLMLMISHENIKGIPSSKLYEYVGLRKPILLFPSDNDIIERTLLDTGLGIICNSEKDIKEKLVLSIENFMKYRQVSINRNEINIEKYTRRKQVEKLALYLNRINTDKRVVNEECLICSSNKLIQLNGYESNYLVRCVSCRFVFSAKKPSQEELVDHYNQYTRDDYLPPLTIKRYNELLDVMEKYRKTNKLLDIGSGMGYFLEQAKRRGWDVYGTEFTDVAIEICSSKGINMFKGALDSAQYENDSFDVITSMEVIEHINNPRIELEKINKFLRSGGLFYCTTPNFNSFSRLYLKNKWNNIIYPEHLSYYTVFTIKKLFKDLKIKPNKVITTGISFSRIKTSKLGKKKNESINPSSIDEKLRNKLESKFYFRGLKKILNMFLTLFRLGDTIKLYGIKE